METSIIILVVVIIAGVAAVIFFMNKKLSELKKPKEDDKSILMLQEQMNQIMQTMDRKMNETNMTLDKKLSESGESNMKFMQGAARESRELYNNINRQFNEMSKHSQDSIKSVTERLTKLDETNKRVVDFSSQLKDLQDILKNPKQRGVLGEYYLEETLKNVLPPNSYEMQYSLGKVKDKELIPDAVVFVKEKIIPIDSKFSLENYERLLNSKDANERKIFEKDFKNDLKKRIDETAKYVRPEKGTVDFAFMFIPSESIYYDLLVNSVGANSRDLIDYAFKEKHVIIVSPTSFLAYLQTVLQGLRALQIEESAKSIRKNVEKLGNHLEKYHSFHQKLGNSLSTTVNHYNHANKEFRKVDKDILKIIESEDGIGIEDSEVDRPKLEE